MLKFVVLLDLQIRRIRIYQGQPGTYTVNAPSHWDRFLGCQFYHVFGPAGYGTNSLETTGADIEQTDVSRVETAIFIVSRKIGELKRRHEECGGQNLTM
jgi:hypothetical protein